MNTVVADEMLWKQLVVYIPIISLDSANITFLLCLAGVDLRAVKVNEIGGGKQGKSKKKIRATLLKLGMKLVLAKKNPRALANSICVVSVLLKLVYAYFKSNPDKKALVECLVAWVTFKVRYWLGF